MPGLQLAVPLGVIFALAGCKDLPRARTEAEITDIATDAASDVSEEQFSALAGRIEQLESKAEELESENQRLRSELSDLQATVDDVNSEVDGIRAQVGY